MKIISGGQTGSDRGGLEAGLTLGIPIGGYCPKHRLAEDGQVPDKYTLVEHQETGYLPRTEANVVFSDATIVFTVGKPTRGSFRTVRFAAIHQRPCLPVELDPTPERDPNVAEEVRQWILDLFGSGYYQPDFVLNIAGNRESRAPGIERRVRDILVAALKGIGI